MAVPEPASEAEAEEVLEEHRARLQGWKELRLRQAVYAQLSLLPAVPTRWQGTLELLATRAAASLRPDPNASINSILKIKTLPGGSRADSHYVDGLVCRLKLAHKCMRTELDWPRILLLKPPLEHESGGFSSSLDALRQQARVPHTPHAPSTTSPAPADPPSPPLAALLVCRRTSTWR